MIRGLVYGAWAFIALIWVAGAFENKRTSREEPWGGRALHLLATSFAFYLLFSPHRWWGFLNSRFLPDSEATQWIGLTLTFTGIAFAIYARFTIGRNWSASVTLKENHRLVRRGPYRIVRHPIYSGALLAILGTGIVFGEWKGPGAFVIALAAWRRKSITEERFMTEFFGEEYRRYQREVKALIPGLL